MDSFDYGNALSKNRENYQKALDTVKKNNQSELDNVRENSKAAVNKAQNNYQEKQVANEEEVKAYKDNVNAKTKKILIDLKEKFVKGQKDLVDEQNAKMAKSREVQRTAAGKMGRDYNEALAQNKEHAKGQIRNALKNSQVKIEQNQRNSENEINNVKKNSSMIVNSAMKDLQNEKVRQNETHDNKQRNLRQALNKQKFHMKNEFDKGNKRMREAFNNELMADKENNNSKMTQQADKEKKMSQKLADNYQELSKNLRDQNSRDNTKLNIQRDNAVGDAKREYRHKLIEEKRKVDHLIKNGFGKAQLEDQLARNNDSFTKRMANIRNQMADQENRFGQQNRITKQSYQDTTKQLSDAHTDGQMKLKRDYDDLLLTTKLEGDRKVGQIHRTFKNKLKEETMAKDEQFQNQVRSGKEALHNQKSQFNDTITKLNKYSTDSINDLKDNQAKEKRTMTEEMRKDFHKRSKGIREHYVDKMAKLSMSYDQRLANQAEMFESKIGKLQTKMANLHDQVAENQRYQDNLRLETQNASKETLKSEVMHAKNVSNRTSENLKKTYLDKLDRLKKENDMTMTKLMRTHRDEISAIRSEHMRNAKRREGLSNSKYDQFIKTSELEKNQIIMNYENKIKNMETVSKQQIEQLRAQLEDANKLNTSRPAEVA